MLLAPSTPHIISLHFLCNIHKDLCCRASHISILWLMKRLLETRSIACGFTEINKPAFESKFQAALPKTAVRPPIFRGSLSTLPTLCRSESSNEK